MRLPLVLLLLAVPGLAQDKPKPKPAIGGLGDLGSVDVPPVAKPVPLDAFDGKADCPADWRKQKKGDCLVPDGSGKAYVNKRGWSIAKACFADSRFTAAELGDALEAAWKKMDPKTGVGAGGCLSAYSPEWGKDLVDALWSKNIYIACPAASKGTTCASTSHDYGRETISMDNVKGCMGKGTTGLAGTLFHETLHANKDDNLSTADHNSAWSLQQIKFVRDRVYGAEAVCFFGTAGKNALVNILQCQAVTDRSSDKDRRDMCDKFSATFTDYPAGFWKHGT
jgi:hypothetical protein